MSTGIVSFLWLVPAMPLAAATLLMAGCRRRRLAAGVAIGAQAAALVLAVAAFAVAVRVPGEKIVHNFTWFQFGAHALRIGWLLDPLSASMLVMITLVGLCIFVFSVGYMAEDAHFIRFFAYLSFFSAAMLGLVVANSLLLLFVCWELVGLASYLLIGFWIHKPSAAAAAKKAFLTTRLGDLGLFLGMLWLFHTSGSLLFYDGGAGCLELRGLALAGAASTFIALLIFCGAIGKSGQFPLHVWLPDAMEGPTPVSALIHAATMVAAGVFLVARTYPLFAWGAIDGVTPALVVVAWVGVGTSLLASLLALGQADIKRILAYSTVSQLGLMMLALGVGGVAAAMMHLLAHAFFKALLFLGAGSVICGCHHEQDIRRMGGLRHAMPVTFFTYAIGMMALAGVPLLFAGAWTKEEILHAAQHWPASAWPWRLALAGVVLTAFYMTRQMVFVFYGEPRAAARRAQESPWVMTVPLAALAGCTVLFSAVLTPAWPWLRAFLEGVPAPVAEGSRLVQPALFVALLLVGAGIAAGAVFYRGAGQWDPLERRLPRLFRVLERKFWVDEIYEAGVVASCWRAAGAVAWLDRHVWDGLVRLVGAAGRCAARFMANFDEGGLNAGGDQAGERVLEWGGQLSAWHAGRIQNYLRALGFGALALLLLYAWLG